MEIIYYNNNKNNRIRIFSNKFVENNKNNCKLIIDNIEKDLCEKKMY